LMLYDVEWCRMVKSGTTRGESRLLQVGQMGSRPRCRESFSELLDECLRVAARGKKRAQLHEIQRILLQRGWHP
jgi:hypothetical protein